MATVGPSVDEVFDEAIRLLGEDARAAYVDQVCGEDLNLKRRVLRLLQAHAEAGHFLETPALDVAVMADPHWLVEQPGRVIGAYKLLQQIGEGGMGVVFMAEQTKPIHREVALKIIKPGMDTRQVISRFEAERQTLAMMDHPNIARVLDAGTTEHGRPYFVMDLVKGVPITEYCDARQFTPRQRLRLFVSVCQAVQHAHQKGIIHRDIKPSNVLVTEYDDKPVPKIIDFGVAKATAHRLVERTTVTECGQFIGTFEYMSPEQACFNQLDVDTRSDIYSLGVLLYELLTGLTPFDKRRFETVAFDETLRIIRDEEPPSPSMRLSSSRLPAKIAFDRQMECMQLRKEVRGDLDWIVMKCLEKAPNRRYETADGLARDIERYLNEEPVAARPPSAIYRFGKLARRNKVAFSAVAGVLTALVLSLCVTTLALLREQAAHDHAEKARIAADVEAQKSQQVAAFLKDMLQSVEPSVALGRDTTMLRQILDATAERVGNDLGGQPEVEAELRSTIGAAYLSLGDFAKAEAMHGEALRLRTSLFGEMNELVAASWNDLARAVINSGDRRRLPEVEASVREALQIRRELLGDEHQDTALSLYLLASVLHRQGKLTEAETTHREALSIRRSLFGDTHQDVAASLNNLALVLIDEGKYEEAKLALHEALATQQKMLGEDHSDTGDSYLNLANVLSRQGQFAEAETAAREALRIYRSLFGDDHARVVAALSRLARTLAQQDKSAEVDEMYDEVLAMQRRLAGDEHPSVATSLENFAALLESQGRFPEAESRYEEALAMRRKILGRYHPNTLISLQKLGAMLRDQGRLAEAESLFRERLVGEQTRVPRDEVQVGSAVAGLTLLLLQARKFAEAEPLAREYLLITANKELYPNPWVGYRAQSLVGASLLGQEKHDEAEPLLLAGYEGMSQSDPPPTTDGAMRLKEVAEQLQQLYESTGRTDKTMEWEKKLRELNTAADR